MFKKLLKAGIAFLLILGCYYGYVHAFSLLVHHLKSGRADDRLVFPIRSSRSKLEAQNLARRTFGDKHWTVTGDLPFAYYNAERGFWMYSQKVTEIQEENGVRYDGKRLRMEPFAVISSSNGGKSTMTLLADSATMDLNQPIALSSKSNTEGIKVIHAHMEGNVKIRDDRGTPSNPADDLNVLPMPYLDFDDATQQITTASHVVMIDPDQKTIGDGLVIQLRHQDPEASQSPSSSTGFGGVKYAILEKRVRVYLRDVGNSGILPGAAPASSRKSGSPKTVELTVNPTVAKSAASVDRTGTAAEPVPLYLQSDGSMRIDWPPDRIPVAIGPPDPPSPTLVRFERNVVALHGRPDRQPNQLDCDTLRLTLVPGGPPSSRPGANKPVDQAGKPPVQTAASAVTVATTTAQSPVPGESAKEAGASAADSKANQGLFGNLTLQKAHATGHVVWLQLRQQGTKVRSSELIHDRRMPYRADSTTFRGDRTRPVWMEKIDFEKEEDETTPATGESRLAAADSKATAPRQVKSVTHVVTLSATLFDQGHGLDLADVRAYGPGRMESRPALNEPVERLAIWQDELIVVNRVDADGKLIQKRVTLTGTRPYFSDILQKTSLDSGRELQVWLKPQSPPPTTTPSSIASSPSPANAFAAASGKVQPSPTATDTASATADTGLGGNLQIERLLAYRDVHLKAPNRLIQARDFLDAPFFEVDPPPAEEPTKVAAADGAGAAEPEADGPPSPDASLTPADPARDAATQGQLAQAAPATSKEPDPAAREPEPTMTGVADRIWAKIALPRGQRLDSGKKSRTRKAKSTARPEAAVIASASSTGTANTPAESASNEAAKAPEGQAEVREAWLRGNVALHQDIPPDPKKAASKPGKQDIFGEAVYLDNQGKGKVNAKVYSVDPTEKTPLLGPVPLARVATDDMVIDGEFLKLDQAHDKVWAKGAGSLSQWTDRALLTDKAPEPTPGAEGSDASAPGSPRSKPVVRDTGMPMASRTGSTTPAGVRTAQGTGPRTTGPATTTSKPRGDAPSRGPSARVAVADGPPAAGRAEATKGQQKPRTRAGRPVGDKDLLTITWTKEMQFDGRSRDTMGHPAGRGDFLGVVRAEMTDAVLYCEQKMIVFTDREVPLADLGSGGPGAQAGRTEAARDADGDEVEAPTESRVNLAMIFCYGNPVAISRKVDPDTPLVLEKQRLEAWDRPGDPTRPQARPPVPGRLDYNRITGEFFVPGPGIVYLYNRPEEGKTDGQNQDPLSPTGSAPVPGASTTSRTPTRAGQRGTGDRAVVPTSAVSTNPDDGPPRVAGRSTATATPASRRAADRALAAPVQVRKIPDLVLTQVEFSTGMRGRMGSGQAEDTKQERWSEFFGDIELVRAKVPDDGVMLDPDRELPEDGFFLTSQMLRIIEIPPPPGSPANAPSRTMVKAWDSVHVNKGLNFTIVADVGTYDSETDVISAYGEGGRGVSILRQVGPGQPATAIPARAVQYGVKSHAWQAVDSNSLRLIDHRTGTRPGNIPIPDPTAPPRKKRKQPFRVPNTNLERRGFTGY